jgi:hypothetical protein
MLWTPYLASFIGFCSVILALVADILLAALWFAPYFRFGLPIYVRTFPSKPATNWPLPAHELEQAFKSSLALSMSFRPLNESQYAFREKLLQFKLYRYLPIMHGLLTWNHAQGSIQIKGYANWFPAVFVAISAIQAIAYALQGSTTSLLIPIACIFIVAISYPVEAYSYAQIGRYAARRWSELQVAYGADA